MASLSNSYNKWDRLEMSDEEDAGSGAGRPDQAERFAAHRQGMALVAQWVGEAAAAHGIEVPAREDLRLLLDFVAAQHRGVRPDNRCRANDVIALVASRGQPRVADLVRLCELARERSRPGGEGGSGSEAREQASRVLEVSVGALNTLAAIAAFGGGEKGARALFDELIARWDGTQGAKYAKFGYAADAIEQASSAELAATEERIAHLRSVGHDTAGGVADDTAGGVRKPWWHSVLRGFAVQLAGLVLALATTQALLPVMQAAGRQVVQDSVEL